MQLVNIENKSQNAVVIKWLLATLFILTFSNFVYRGFTTNDDLEYYVVYNSPLDIWDFSFGYAKQNGRFYFMFMQPLFNLIIPNFIPNPLISQLLNLAVVFSSIIFIGQILKKVLHSNMYQYVFILITLIFLNIKSDNNALISYPFYFTLSFSFLTFSLLSYIYYCQEKKIIWLVSSLFFFCCALLFYENYLLYIPLYFFLAIYTDTSEENFIKKISSRKDLLYFILIGFTYILVYYIFKTSFAKANYDGVTVANNIDIFAIANTITGITRGAYPLFNYFTSHGVYENMSLNNYGHIQNIFNPIINIETSWLVKALLIGLTTYLLFTFIQKDSKKVLKSNSTLNYLGVLVVIVLIYLPQLLISLTVKYQRYAEMGMSSYVTTYFSTYPVYILLTIIFIYIYITLPKDSMKRILKYTLIIFFSFFSILTDYANSHAARDLKNIHKHFEAVNLLLETEKLNAIPDNSIIIAPELYNNKTNMSYYNCCDFKWSNYFKVKLNKKDVIVLKNDRSIKLNHSIENIYYLGYSKNTRENDQFFIFTKIKKQKDQPISYLSEEITLYSYSASKDFSLQLYTERKQTNIGMDSIMVCNKKIRSKKPYFDLHITYSKKSDFFIPITINGNKLDSKSVVFYINTFDDNTNIVL